MRPSNIRHRVMLVSLLVVLSAVRALAGSSSRTTICHIPPGNPQNAHTIVINALAVSPHLAHGDYLGECQPQVCAPGETASCYGGPAGTAGVGPCSEGTQTCNALGTAFGPCVGEVMPAADSCGDGIDNDCDGVADDGCVCTPGSAVPCYDGPAGTEGVGVCQAGTQNCNATGTGYGPCVGAVTPASESCGDGLDHDCDGMVDDGCICTPNSTSACYSGPPSTEDIGACMSGTKTCNSTGTEYGPCIGEIFPIPEVCIDGIDNDCDGISDNGCVCSPGSQAACYGGPAGTVGVGVCQVGTQTCDAWGEGYGPCAGDVVPSAETCGDGLDNDCDGTADDGCIGDRAWRDVNGNGLQDSGELGLAGVALFLRTSSGNLVAIDVSDGAGVYHFSNVPAGTYYVEVSTPSGYALTSNDVGANDTIDSDFDAETGETALFVFSGSTSAVDAGFVPSS